MENMDAVQQNHRPMRPMIDPHQQQQAGWYSGQPQFHYPGVQQQQQQWAPPPPLDQYGQVLNQHYPIPPPPPQRPMPPHQVTHMYAQPDQAWANPGWSHQQPWDFTAGNNTGVNNEDVWAAKAKAWAAGKAAMESQQASQFAPINRPVEHQVYQGHYTQPFHPQFSEPQQPSFPGLVHQSVQPHAISAPNITANQVQDSSSRYSNDVSSSYVSDVFMSYGSKDSAAIQEQNAPGISSQGSIPSAPNYSQEMSMNYSSVPGFEEQAKQMPTQNSPLASSVDLQQDEYMLQSQMHSTSTSQPTEHPHFTYSDQQEASVPEVSHQQPEFERDAHDYHQHQQSGYLQPVQTMASDGQEYNGPAPSVPGWSQLGPFPPVPPAVSLNHQFEPPYTSIPHPIHGHPAHLFGRVPGPQPGPGFRPNMPPIGVSFGMGPLSPSLPPGQLGMVGPAFMGENNGAFGVSERPKKASVPNWLREELKKKAAVVANTSAQGNASEDAFGASGSEDVNQSLQKSDYTDIRTVDSHRSSDDEDEEDEVEATRTAAINQEIKRVLTEVLKKVTDDLFDEIAQEVLDEDDDIIQVKKQLNQPVNDRGRTKISRLSPPPPQVKPTTVATKVVVSANNVNASSGEEEDNSSSSAPGGNVLGLANYASDDEDDGPDQAQQVSSHVSEQQDASLLEEKELREDHGSQSKPGEPNIIEYVKFEKSKDDRKIDTGEERDNPRIKENHEDVSVNKDVVRVGEEHENFKAMSSPDTPKYMNKGLERHQVNVKSNHNDVEDEKRRSNDSKEKESRSKGFDKTDTRKSAAEVKIEEREMKIRKGDDLVQQRKDGDKGREREREKEKEKRVDRERVKDGEKGRERERERERDREREREKIKNTEKIRALDKKSDKEKTREREGRKDSERAHDKERKKDHTREKRATDNSKKNDKERGERNGTGKERDLKDTGKRRKRSSSVSSRGRNSKVDSYDSNSSSSDPEGSERTRRRKLQSSRRSSSPSRSRNRQVSRSRSRSPHARHSHRRHSPYSSHDARRKRSRSGSPVHRRR